jgi:uncharacterized protein (DUF1015 family)
VAQVVPFKCWRPREELSQEVAAAPYDTFSRDEAVCEIAAHPLSFLRIDKSAALVDSTMDEYDPQVYCRAREELAAWYEQGVVIPEDEPLQPYYYLYRLTQGTHQQTGLVACASVADYENDVIKRHENTREKKELDRVEHIKALEAHTGPVLLTYPSVEALDNLLEEAMQEAALLYDFVAPDGVHHEFWRIDSEKTTEAIQSSFARIPALYIADGHHRAAAAAQVAKIYRSDESTEAPEAEHFLVAVFGSKELKVLDYNRVVSDLAELNAQELLAAIGAVMDLEAQGSEPYRPSKRGELSMYLAGTWYKLQIREAGRPKDAVHGLDVALLHSAILAPILHIEDPRSDSRISYVGGARGLAELAERADETGGVAFALYPCSLAELFAVADEDRLMPPKSTWFEPKPRSGLAIHRIV